MFHEPLGAGGGGSPGPPAGPGDSPLSAARNTLARAGLELFLARRQSCGLLLQALGDTPLQNEVGRHPLAMGTREFWGRVCIFLDKATSEVF